MQRLYMVLMINQPIKINAIDHSVKIAFTVNGEAKRTKPANAGFVCVAPGIGFCGLNRTVLGDEGDRIIVVFRQTAIHSCGVERSWSGGNLRSLKGLPEASNLRSVSPAQDRRDTYPTRKY
jgi:hypothetical protein